MGPSCCLEYHKLDTFGSQVSAFWTQSASSHTSPSPTRDRAVPCNLISFPSATIARAPCRSCHHLFRAGPTDDTSPTASDPRLFVVSYPDLLISSISYLLPLPLDSHCGHVPSGLFMRVWTPLSVSWADLRKSLPSPTPNNALGRSQFSRPGFAVHVGLLTSRKWLVTSGQSFSTFGLGFQTTNPNRLRSHR